MGDISLVFKGDKVTKHRFQQLEKRVQGKLMSAAMKKAMVPVQKLAIKLSPKDTGKLAKSIKVRAFRSRRRGLTGAKVITGTRKQLGIADDAKYYYPAAHEYGTEETEARPFMRSALAMRKGQAFAIARAEIVKLVEGHLRGN